jgi:dTDP-4-dehydrorhamnose reductase
MTRLLVLGASGMLGHKVWQECGAEHETWATVRGDSAAALAAVGEPDRVITGVDAGVQSSVETALDACTPDVVVNCIGIVKQDAAAEDPLSAIAINALLPHQLAVACRRRGARLVQISTDCVFSGRAGNYDEQAPPDPVDLYGRSKLLGEVDGPGCLTLRTSIIGRELRGHLGLLDWFLLERPELVGGYTKALFSGLSTVALARVISALVETPGWPTEGLWNVSADPISKYDLLELVRTVFELDVEIVPNDTVAIDRTLDSSRFRAATGWTPQTWRATVEELAADQALYEGVAR